MWRWIAVVVVLAGACNRRDPVPLPRECETYTAAIADLARCQDLPGETRFALTAIHEQTRASWTSVSIHNAQALAASCSAATAHVRQAALACKNLELEMTKDHLPEACRHYAAAMERLAKCDKLPQATRDALQQSYEQTKSAWAAVPPEGMPALATACSAAADAVIQTSAACQ